ncbi:hypothetical protein [Miltoncostaea marina]|uniref:hypothetical protein n=1 Tax=Miltoncostaea marina TaxID=2843215 RepID=UPI001C3E0670|nr:hypothetical protein [Miltoncostaea marina]
MQPSEDDEQRCPACGEVIPEEWWVSHLAGADRRRIDCPAQDLVAVARRQQPGTAFAQLVQAPW